MLAESLMRVLAQRPIGGAHGGGRIMAVEILAGNRAVASLICEKKTFHLGSVIPTGRREGMQSMDDAILTFVRGGVLAAGDAAGHLSNRDLLPGGARGASGRPEESGAMRQAA